MPTARLKFHQKITMDEEGTFSPPCPTPSHDTPQFPSCLNGVEKLQNHLKGCPEGSDGETLPVSHNGMTSRGSGKSPNHGTSKSSDASCGSAPHSQMTTLSGLPFRSYNVIPPEDSTWQRAQIWSQVAWAGPLRHFSTHLHLGVPVYIMEIILLPTS